MRNGPVEAASWGGGVAGVGIEVGRLTSRSMGSSSSRSCSANRLSWRGLTPTGEVGDVVVPPVTTRSPVHGDDARGTQT